MIAIDELKASSLHGVTKREVDPIVHDSDGCIWTLGMVLSMWAYVFERSTSEICERKIWF